jgi:hypothetical protein
MRRLLLLLTAAALFALPSSAQAARLLGVVGSPYRMHNQTAQDSNAVMRFTGWGGGWRWGGDFPDLFDVGPGRVPVFAVGIHAKGTSAAALTPRQVANGAGDGYLMAMGRAISAWGKPIYVRPFPEMNGYWNGMCAFNQNGSYRGAAHSTRNFRLAFRRLYLILHGGDVATMNARFHKWGMRRLQSRNTALPVNRKPTLKVLWNPQGFGSPDIPANSAQAYYPGNPYVDVVGDDIYDQGGRYEYDAMVDLYKAHPKKPFALGEFGLWGVDDPAFIRRMAYFIRNYRRTELAIYYESESGSQFDLGNKGASRVAYKRYLSPLG